WSNGSLVAALLNWLKLDLNQTFSPTISARVCVCCPCESIQSDTRQVPEPPDPDSCGMVSLIRSSKAPTVNAPFPFLEQPVAPSRAVSIRAAGVFSRASMKRLTPQAQAIMAPAEWPLPNTS